MVELLGCIVDLELLSEMVVLERGIGVSQRRVGITAGIADVLLERIRHPARVAHKSHHTCVLEIY